jgi:hypothetical protein
MFFAEDLETFVSIFSFNLHTVVASSSTFYVETYSAS